MRVAEKITGLDPIEKLKAEEAELRVVREPRGRRMFPPLEIKTPGPKACDTCPVIREEIVGGDSDPNGLGSGLPFYYRLFKKLPIGPESKYTGFPSSITRAQAVATEIGGKKLGEKVSDQVGAAQAVLEDRFYRDKGEIPSLPSTWIPDHMHGPMEVHCRSAGGNCATVWVETESDTKVVFNRFSNPDLGSQEKYYGIPLEPIFVPVAHKVACPALKAGQTSAKDMDERFADRLSLSLKSGE